MKKLLNMSIKLPVIGSVSVRDIVKTVVLSGLAGGAVWALTRTPVVGPYVSAGLAKVAPFMLHRQA